MKLASKAALVMMALLAATPASAQEEIDRWQNTVSFSPILALFEILVADYERSVGEEATIGLGVAYWNYNEDVEDEFDESTTTDATYAALDLKGRFYPDRAFKGWELGGSIGVARVGFHDDDTGDDDDATGFSYGVEVGHGWLLGDNERWFLGAAIGAKRFWFGEEDDDLPSVMPTGRLSFGIAF